jgi:hypothetical protein
MPKKPSLPTKKSAAHKHRTNPKGGQPIFGQPQPSPDPSGFKDPVTDKSLQELANLEPVPVPVNSAIEPILTLAQVYGSKGTAKTQAIQQAGQIVFHSVGDTGSASGPSTQSLVADKMVTDFSEVNAADVPSFFFHLGDIVYYFGEATYYYDQFYEPFRNLPGADYRHTRQSRRRPLRRRSGANACRLSPQLLCSECASIARFRGPVTHNHDSAWRVLHIRGPLRANPWPL